MPARRSILPVETFQRADALDFDQRTERDLWAFAFNANADAQIEALGKPGTGFQASATPVAMPQASESDPLPIVVSPRPETTVPNPQVQQPTPSGTPAAMPTAPGLAPATITSGPGPGQTLQAGESVGSVTLAGGSNPEQQAIAYQEALAAGLDDEGARILVAVTETEGGMTGAIGDEGQSRGAYQFYEGGQMPGFRAWVRAQGIQGDPDQLVHDVRLSTRYAATTYLGRAIAAGRQQGLSGAELATYVQRHGQVSVNPEKAGQNYQRLYGPGSQTYPDRGQPAVPQNTPPAPLTPPQASDQRTYPESSMRPANENPGSAQYQRPGAQKFRAVDTWGNEYVVTQEQLDRTPGGSGLTILGPVAMNNAGAMPPPVASAPASPGAPPAGAGLPLTVAQKWRAQFGRDPSPEEAAELMGVLS